MSMVSIGMKVERSSTGNTLELVADRVTGHGINKEIRQGTTSLHEPERPLIHDLDELPNYVSVFANITDIETLRKTDTGGTGGHSR